MVGKAPSLIFVGVTLMVTCVWLTRVIGGCNEIAGLHEGIPRCSHDGVKNGSETDVDCGGGCGPCEDGRACVQAEDCESLVCGGSLCKAPTCTDGVQNGGEIGVDCMANIGIKAGCYPCSAGTPCAETEPEQCLSGVCDAGTCQPSKDCGYCRSDNDCDVGVCVAIKDGYGFGHCVDTDVSERPNTC